MAMTAAVGWPAATSLARLGPVSTPIRRGSFSGEASATTWVIVASVSCSMPLVRESTGMSAPSDADAMP